MAYKKIMTDADLKQRILDICSKETCYLYGGIGQTLTLSVLNAKAKQLPSWYTEKRISALKALINSGTKYTGFDCVGVIKSILWGYGTDSGMKYASNTVPDTSANGFINCCEDVSTDMTNIKPMEVIWFSGHVGLYLYKKDGVDYCVECAPSINKVGITKMSYQGKWCKHGKMPWITYGSILEDNPVKSVQAEINDLIAKGYISLPKLVEDGIWGTKTATAWLAMQSYLLAQKKITYKDVAKMAGIIL